ncbi:MAG TPA: RIP metalloprotease RseP [Deltaproteobacteria bacterium]|nr:MAG: RIP metalloprotease RseP [Deltaproteobacteria bacterium]RLB03729.1 MAG: RIP metalloprotease RseP [Deltaproteobacteria bacterium]HDM79020.1 RIP metalloprotease RseP [Deltaproteobacteria bacterium]HEC31919.1 RIP metalloprotease RseP [Deltaproteobacteria bacterium]
MTTIFATVIVLGVLIFFHELGHFLVAKYFRVGVLKFSLGFGPAIISKKVGETEYCISAIPLGGYVKLLGESSNEDVPEDKLEASFSNQPVGRRAAIVAAGPIANFLLAIVFFSFVFAVSGIPQLSTEIGAVTKDSPAEKAGLKPGDKVVAVNGQPVTEWEEMSKLIKKSGGKSIQITIERGKELIQVSVVPEISKVKNIFGEEIERPLIGVTAAQKVVVKKVNPVFALYYGVEQTWTLTKLFVLTVIKMIERVVPAKTLGGPIFIAQLAGQQARQGIMNLIYFIGLISVNLAILNLLPVPVLDGGHLAFFAFEAITGKPVSMEKREIAQQVGLFLLIILMVFVFYNDISRILLQKKEILTPKP